MANINSLLLNAVDMTLPLACAGMSRVGIRISAITSATVVFEGSFDGINWQSIKATPFASGTAVASSTATGTWYFNVQNYVAVRCRLSAGTSAAVVLAASIDASYQNAFLDPGTINSNSVASGAINTLTVAAQANRRWRLRTLTVTLDATATWGAKPVVQVTDGASGTILWAGDLPTAAAVYIIPLPAGSNTPGVEDGGVVGTVNTAMVVVVQSGGGSVKTNINAEVSAA